MPKFGQKKGHNATVFAAFVAIFVHTLTNAVMGYVGFMAPDGGEKSWQRWGEHFKTPHAPVWVQSIATMVNPDIKLRQDTTFCNVFMTLVWQNVWWWVSAYIIEVLKAAPHCKWAKLRTLAWRFIFDTGHSGMVYMFGSWVFEPNDGQFLGFGAFFVTGFNLGCFMRNNEQVLKSVVILSYYHMWTTALYMMQRKCFLTTTEWGCALLVLPYFPYLLWQMMELPDELYNPIIKKRRMIPLCALLIGMCYHRMPEFFDVTVTSHLKFHDDANAVCRAVMVTQWWANFNVVKIQVTKQTLSTMQTYPQSNKDLCMDANDCRKQNKLMIWNMVEAGGGAYFLEKYAKTTFPNNDNRGLNCQEKTLMWFEFQSSQTSLVKLWHKHEANHTGYTFRMGVTLALVVFTMIREFSDFEETDMDKMALMEQLYQSITSYICACFGWGGGQHQALQGRLSPVPVPAVANDQGGYDGHQDGNPPANMCPHVDQKTKKKCKNTSACQGFTPKGKHSYVRQVC